VYSEWQEPTKLRYAEHFLLLLHDVHPTYEDLAMNISISTRSDIPEHAKDSLQSPVLFWGSALATSSDTVVDLLTLPNKQVFSKLLL
jgi:hypothetical protein